MSEIKLPESTLRALMEYREAKEKWVKGSILDSAYDELERKYRLTTSSLAVHIDAAWAVHEEGQ